MGNPASPLTADHHQQIIQGLARIKLAEDQIALAKMAKIDVTQQEQRLQEAKDKLNLLRSVYFPNGM